MKEVLTKLCWPILSFFEDGEEAVNLKRSHRVITVVVGVLFVVLSLVSAGFALSIGEPGGLVPVLVFFALGLVAVIVGTLGSDSAITKIWGRR